MALPSKITPPWSLGQARAAVNGLIDHLAANPTGYKRGAALVALGTETNLHTNPQARVGTTGFTPDSAGTVAAADTVWRSSALRWSRTSAGTTVLVLNLVNGSGARFPLTAGQTITVGVRIRASVAGDYTMVGDTYTSGNAWNSYHGGHGRIIEAGQEAYLWLTLVAPANSATIQPYIQWKGKSGASVPAGTITRVTDVLVVVGGMVKAGPFNGNDPGCRWTGEPHASTSVRDVAVSSGPHPGGLAATSPGNRWPGGVSSSGDVPGWTRRVLPRTTPPMPAYTKTSIWTMPASSLTVLSNASSVMTTLQSAVGSTACFTLTGVSGSQWASAVYWAGPQDPSYDVQMTGGAISPTTAQMRGIRIPVGAQALESDDAQIFIYDLDAGHVIFLWRAQFDGTTWTAQGGARYYLDSNGINSDVQYGDARNVGYQGKSPTTETVLWSDVLRGRIPGVIRCALPVSAVRSISNGAHIWPHKGTDSTATGGTNAVPEGAFLRLKQNIDPATKYTTLTPVEQVFAAQLKEFGLYVGDVAGGGKINLPAEDTTLQHGIDLWPLLGTQLLSAIPLADLEPCYRPPQA